MRIFSDNDAEEIVVITRKEIEIHSPGNVPIRQVVRETPSSMHSFHEISRYLADAPFVLTTVDTIFREDEFRKYISFFRTALQDGDDGLMGVTDFVDDDEHGDLVKFYGITPSSFFHIMYPTDAAKTKFGLEVYNDKPQFYDFDREDLRTKACCLADVLGIKVFGGDAIIHKDGT